MSRYKRKGMAAERRSNSSGNWVTVSIGHGVHVSKERSLKSYPIPRSGRVYIGPTVEGVEVEFVKIAGGKVTHKKPSFA